MQCVDVLKQIAGDDRDTEHQFRVPSHSETPTHTQILQKLGFNLRSNEKDRRA